MGRQREKLELAGAILPLEYSFVWIDCAVIRAASRPSPPFALVDSRDNLRFLYMVLRVFRGLDAATSSRLLSVELPALSIQLAWTDSLGFLSALVRICNAARVSSRPVGYPHTTDHYRVYAIRREIT